MAFWPHDFLSLPVELLHDIQLYASSPSLPIVCKHLHHAFRHTTATYRARYILKYISNNSLRRVGLCTRVLRFRLCTQEVLEAILRLDPSMRKKERTAQTGIPALPAHLFSQIKQRPNFGQTGAPVWKERDHPLPFLRYLFSSEVGLTPLDVNAHGGYALTKAVHAGFRPLIQFLLYHGADPSVKGNLAVLVAIRQKDLSLVKILIERIDLMMGEHDDDPTPKSKGKKRKLPDRISVVPEMLKVAVQCDAREIVEYLVEKGCVPDMTTLNMLERA